MNGVTNGAAAGQPPPADSLSLDDAPLLVAARRAEADVLAHLLKSGHNVAETDALGWTSVHHLCASSAPSGQKAESLQVLQRHGADVDAQNSSLQIGLHIAASHVQDISFLAQMLLSVRDTGARDALGRTALHYVALGASVTATGASSGSLVAVPTPRANDGQQPLLMSHASSSSPQLEEDALKAARLVLRHAAVDARDLDSGNMTGAALAESKGQRSLASFLRSAEARAARASRSLCRNRMMPLVMCMAIGGAHAGCLLFTLPSVPTAAPSVLLACVLLVLLVSGVTTGFADPGYLRPQQPASSTGATHRPPHRSVDPTFCHTCNISRPLRSKHCRVCDSCVRDFDHHCPWLGNCIGRRNRGAFYVFVTALVVDTTALFTIGLLAALEPRDHPPYWLCTSAESLCAPYNSSHMRDTARGMTWALVVGAAVMTMPLSIFWYRRTRNLLSNLTTNEWHNRKRYPHFKSMDGSFINPFDQGVAANCDMFFCPAVPRSASTSDGGLLERVEVPAG